MSTFRLSSTKQPLLSLVNKTEIKPNQSDNPEEIFNNFTNILNNMEFVSEMADIDIYSSLGSVQILSMGKNYSSSTTAIISDPDKETGSKAACDLKFGLTKDSLIITGTNATVGDLIVIQSPDPNGQSCIITITRVDNANNIIKWHIDRPGTGFDNSLSSNINYTTISGLQDWVEASISLTVNITFIPDNFAITSALLTNKGSGYKMYTKENFASFRNISIELTNYGSGQNAILYGSFLPEISQNPDLIITETPSRVSSAQNINKFDKLRSTISPVNIKDQINNVPIFNFNYPIIEPITAPTVQSYAFDANSGSWVAGVIQNNESSSDEQECKDKDGLKLALSSNPYYYMAYLFGTAIGGTSLTTGFAFWFARRQNRLQRLNSINALNKLISVSDDTADEFVKQLLKSYDTNIIRSRFNAIRSRIKNSNISYDEAHEQFIQELMIETRKKMKSYLNKILREIAQYERNPACRKEYLYTFLRNFAGAAIKGAFDSAISKYLDKADKNPLKDRYLLRVRFLSAFKKAFKRTFRPSNPMLSGKVKLVFNENATDIRRIDILIEPEDPDCAGVILRDNIEISGSTIDEIETTATKTTITDDLTGNKTSGPAVCKSLDELVDTKTVARAGDIKSFLRSLSNSGANLTRSARTNIVTGIVVGVVASSAHFAFADEWNSTTFRNALYEGFIGSDDQTPVLLSIESDNFDQAWWQIENQLINYTGHGLGGSLLSPNPEDMFNIINNVMYHEYDELTEEQIDLLTQRVINVLEDQDRWNGLSEKGHTLLKMFRRSVEVAETMRTTLTTEAYESNLELLKQTQGGCKCGTDVTTTIFNGLIENNRSDLLLPNILPSVQVKFTEEILRQLPLLQNISEDQWTSDQVQDLLSTE